MVELRKITEENFIDAFNLTLAAGQEAFVSHPIRSLAQAYVYREQCQPFGIYADGEMVGYVMVIYDYDIPEYDIWHMMIDAAQQGKGYGSAAMGLRIRTFLSLACPFRLIYSFFLCLASAKLHQKQANYLEKF